MTSTSDRDPKPEPVTGYPAASTAGTAYPYPPPPPPHAATYYPTFNTYTPNPNPNPNYYPNTNPNSNGYYPNPDPNHYRRRLLLRRFLAVAVAIFIIIGAITFIIWLVLRPKLPEFAVASLTVSSLNLSSNTLSASFDLRLAVRNPNKKMSTAYDEVTAGVLYDGDPIAETSMPPFYQGTGNVTEIRASLVAAEEYVGNDVVSGIRSERGSGDGVVRFGVRVFAIVRFKAGAWRTRSHVLRVICGRIGVGFKNSTNGVGSMVRPARQCLVGL